MNKLDANPAALTFAPASSPHPRPAHRLIVLIPESKADTAHTAQKIWELAKAIEGPVQFLGLSKDAAHEPGLRRQIATLSAMVEDENISVESKIELGNNWLGLVRSEWQDGDVIVCFAQQTAGLTQRPLNQILESNLHATVYVFTDTLVEERIHPSWMYEVATWMGSIGIILGFYLLQVKLVQSSQNAAYTILLYTSIIVEAISIWVWNNVLDHYAGK